MKKILLFLILIIIFSIISCGGAMVETDNSYDLVKISDYKPAHNDIKNLEKEFFERYASKDFDAALICATHLLDKNKDDIKYNYMYYDSMMHVLENNKNDNNINNNLYYDNLDIILRNIYILGEENIDIIISNKDEYVTHLYYMAADYIDSISIYE